MFESLGLESWHLWLIAGCIIAAIELLLLNSYYLLAMAGGAAMVGAVSAIFDISLASQWLVFGIATSLTTWWMHSLRTSKQPELADDITYMEGKLVEVLEPISPRGRVMYKGVSWAAESESIFETGETARIERVNGSTLYVRKVNSGKV